jgi:PAS domain S-box-containing protein
MLVDDEVVITTQLEERLTSMGYEVIGSASSGPEAVNMASNLKPDIILMDIVMPGKLNGIGAAETIRTELDVPVIFLTAYAEDKHIKRAKNVEAFGYLVKPCHEKEIRASIEVALYKKHMERQLRASEQKHRSVVDTAADAIIIADSDRNIVSWNHAAEIMFGYSVNESAGKPFTLIVPEHTRQELESAVDCIVSTGKSDILAKTVEYSGLRKDGSEFPVELSLATWQTKEDIFFTFIIRDITARKRVEEALKESNHSLEEALAELRQTQLQVIQQERLRALGQMASAIVHDFNNALTPILGYTDLMRTVPPLLNDKEKVKNYLDIINTAARNAAEITRNLRSFYSQRTEIDIFAPVNPTQLIEQAIELAQPRWKNQALASGIIINIETDLRTVPPVSGSETELQAMLINLIFNAVDAMPEGGTITMRTYSDDEQVIIAISDTGKGMTEEVKQRCFEPFFSTKDDRSAGLGLAVVYGIIQRHEGRIEIESEEGKGTTFIVCLPIQGEARVEGERDEKATVPPLHILLVEDRPMVRQIIRELLLFDRHTVETANNGRGGLAKFHEGKFDLVLTDRAMPDMSGDELAVAIKQAAPKQYVIMLTGYGEMLKHIGEIPEGVDELLSKPVAIDELRKALTKVIGQ